jgi:crotonobetainyl-CoA:carnitine CoA-transferase CaiB-like acyl-CoA transferase
MTAGDPARPFAVLEGLRVIEVAQNLAGPFCARILGDLGADVVKIEPPGGDAARGWGPPFHQEAGTIFAFANTGKRSVVLDLKSRAGGRVLRRLLESADILVDALRPGALARMGFADEAVAELNPRLIRLQVLAYGETGPLADLPGYEPLMQAHAGIMASTGPEGGPPVRVGTSLVDMGTGMWGALAVLAALRVRERTGRGTRISTALFDTAALWSGYHLLGAADAGFVPAPMGTELPMISPYGAVPTADGQLMVSAGNDRLFRRLCDALGLDDLPDDPRFGTNPDRVAHRREVNRRIQSATRAHTTAELLDVLRAAGVPCAPVKDVGELLDDPQFEASGMLTREEGPGEGSPSFGIRLPLRWDGARAPGATSVPRVGEHTSEVLEELGL